MIVIEKINKLNMLLVEWNQTDKSQRFGQFVQSNTDMVLSSELYNSHDSYWVYSEIISTFEKEK